MQLCVCLFQGKNLNANVNYSSCVEAFRVLNQLQAKPSILFNVLERAVKLACVYVNAYMCVCVSVPTCIMQ